MIIVCIYDTCPSYLRTSYVRVCQWFILGTYVSVVLCACVTVFFPPSPRLPADPAALQIPVLAAHGRLVPGAKGELLHLHDKGKGYSSNVLVVYCVLCVPVLNEKSALVFNQHCPRSTTRYDR